jgi:hypothetical protein
MYKRELIEPQEGDKHDAKLGLGDRDDRQTRQ